MNKVLNLINRYSVLFLNGNFEDDLDDKNGVELVFYNEGYGMTFVVINNKVEEFNKIHNLEKYITYGLKLTELDDVSKHPSEFYNAFDIIKKKLNWDNCQLNTSIGLFKQGIEPDLTFKYKIKVKDIDDSLNYLDYYCESVNVIEFLNNHEGIIEIETQLTISKIKEVLGGAYMELLLISN